MVQASRGSSVQVALLSLILSLIFSSLNGQLRINEVCASNSTLLIDRDGDTPDWIELFNAGQDPVNLAGYSLRDDAITSDPWIFPSYTLDPGAYLVLFASGKSLDGPVSNWKGIITEGVSWKYILPNSSLPGWENAGFDDSSWEIGNSGFGYGDGDDATVVEPTPSIYLRKRFNIDDPSSISDARLHMDYDDGFAAYLNGVEIARENLVSNASFDQFALGNHEALMYNGGVPEAFTIADPENSFLPGENLLAIEVHNVSGSSSDLSAIPFLSVLSGSEPGDAPVANLGLIFSTFHTNFKLSAAGDSIFLAAPDGTLIDSFVYNYLGSDHSFGRTPGNPESWKLFQEPTPFGPNSSAYFEGYIQSDPLFSVPGGLYSQSQQVEITAEPGDTIFFTLDGSEPDSSDLLYTDPIQVTENTIINARIFRKGYIQANPTVHSYLFADHPGVAVISLTTDSENLWDYNNGIYVMGPNPGNDYPYFNANFWQDWERGAHLEIYDEQQQELLNTGVGLKIFGAWSRALPQKSFSVFARDVYGDNSFKAPLFPGSEIKSYEALVFRNSGNDWFGGGNQSGTMMRDMLMTGLCDPLHLEYQQAHQAVLYLNGEYWGIQNIREKVNEHFIASKREIAPDRLDMLTNNQEVIHGDNEHYQQLVQYINNSTLALESRYEYVSGLIEVQNYINYLVAQIYFDNTDWPGNNIKYWRPDYEHGRWRWILYDTDFGFGIWDRNKAYSNTLDFALEPYNSNWPNPSWATLLFRKLAENETFKKQFVNTFADHLNTTFAPTRVNEHIDSLSNRIWNEMEGHTERWGGSIYSWRDRISDLHYFANNRVNAVRQHIQGQFGLGSPTEIQFSINNALAGKLLINTMRIQQGEWSGIYFSGIPITVTAIPEPGYRFVSWSGDFTGYEPQISFDPSSVQSITANFIALEQPALDRVIINEIALGADSLNATRDWIELYNSSEEYVDLSGWIITDSRDSLQFKMEEGTVIAPGGFHVVTRNRYAFRAQHPQVEEMQGNLPFGLDSFNDAVRLFSPDSTLMDEVVYLLMDPWPTVGDDHTLSLISPDLNNTFGNSWASSDQSMGTPGGWNFTTSVEDQLQRVDDAPDSQISCYPNPFTGSISVQLQLPSTERVKLSLMDMRGTVREVLVDHIMIQGEHQLEWSPELDPGIYLLQLQTAYSLETIRVVKQ